MRSASRIALLLAVLLVAWLVYDRLESAAVVAPPPEVGAESTRRALESPKTAIETPLANSASDERAEVASATGGAIRFVDAASGEPVAGLTYRIRDLSSAEPLLASGVSDERGVAERVDLPRKPLVVVWDRHPPHALGAQLVDAALETADALRVQVGRGGSIAGRAVDDAGAPIEGVRWFATNGSPGLGGYPQYDADAGPSAVTDADGRFVVNALSERPRKLRIEDGELTVGVWERVALMAPNPFLSSGPIGFLGEPLGANEDLILAEPVVFKRPCTVIGRLVLADGSPALAHFVTSNYRERFGGQYDPPTSLDAPLEYQARGFPIEINEYITDAAGAFSFQSAPVNLLRFWVVDAVGRLWEIDREFEVDEHGTIDLGVITLEDFRTCTIRLVSSAGEPWEPEAFRYAGPQLVTRPDLLMVRTGGTVSLSFVDERGRVRSEYYNVRPGGRLRFVPDVDPSSIRSVGVFTGNFLPTRLTLQDGFDPAREYAVTLEPQPELHVTVALSGDAPDLDEFRLCVHACVASRAQREAAIGGSIDDEERFGRAGCCRLGSAKVAEWRGGTFTAELPVLSDDEYRIYIRGRGRSTELPVQVHGPFRPGPDVRALSVSADAFRAIVPTEEEVIESATRERGSDTSAWAYITINDARTGELASHATVISRGLAGPNPRTWRHGVRPTEDGRGRVQFFSTKGLHQLTAAADGYLDVDLGVHDLVLGETIDLGTVALEPHPHFRIRVLESDGTPVAAGTRVYSHVHQVVFGEDGVLTVLDEMPQDFLISLGGWGGGFHVLEVNGWSADEVREVRLSPTRDVEVVVRGLAPQHELSRMVMYLIPATIQLDRYGDGYFRRGYASIGQRRIEGASHREPGTVSFAAELAAGTYRVEFESPLYAIPPARIEVGRGEGTQVFEFNVTR